MTPLKEIGECLIGAGGREYFFRPSFRNMTRIGEPEHIVRTFYALFNDDVAKMLEASREIHSVIWTVNSIKPNTDNTVSLTVAEYSDAIYQ